MTSFRLHARLPRRLCLSTSATFVLPTAYCLLPTFAGDAGAFLLHVHRHVGKAEQQLHGRLVGDPATIPRQGERVGHGGGGGGQRRVVVGHELGHVNFVTPVGTGREGARIDRL